MSRANKIRLLLLVVIVLVFGRIATHDFVDWDDGPLIFNNPNISNHSFTGLLHHWNPWSTDNTSMYNPLVFTLWWVIGFFSSVQVPDLLGATLNPYLFHTASLAVHWLCACVVFAILRMLKFRDWPAGAGALIFAVHPLQAESVAWAVGMKDLLSGLFSFLTIQQYLTAIQSEGERRKWHYWLSTVCFMAALLSKPSTVVLPLIVTAIGLFVYHRPWRELLVWTIPWYILSLGCAIIASVIQTFPEAEVHSPLWERPLVALDALAFYLGKIVLPVHLTFDYGRNPVALIHDPNLYHPLYWTWIFPVALATIIWRSKKQLLWGAGLIFVLGLLPVLGLKPFAYQYYTTVADRYVYVSMLGIAIAVAWWLDRGAPSARWIVTIAIVVFSCLSFVQADRWRDTETLYDLSLTTSKPVHNLTIGKYHDDLAAPLATLTTEAFSSGHYAQGLEYHDKTVAELEKAMSYYRTAIRLAPRNTNGYAMLAKDQIFLKQIPEAIETVKAWMKIDPTLDPSVDLVKPEPPGFLQAGLASLYLRNRQFAEAVAMYKESLALRPDPDTQKAMELAESLLAQSTSRPANSRPATAP